MASDATEEEKTKEDEQLCMDCLEDALKSALCSYCYACHDPGQRLRLRK